MTEPIFETGYWRRRLQKNPKDEDLYKSVYICTADTWEEIGLRHKKVLAEKVGPQTTILDAGCGYGRLLTLLPEEWHGRYLGLDLSPDFVRLAKKIHRDFEFQQADLRNLNFLKDHSFDLGILISIRQMVISNVGIEAWEWIDRELRRVCKDILILEYGE